MAQFVNCLTFGCGSGYDFMGCGIEHCVKLPTQQRVLLEDSFSLPFPQLLCSLKLFLSLKQIHKSLNKTK